MTTIKKWQIKPETTDELNELLREHGISTADWGTGTIHSLDKLLRTLNECNVYFELPHSSGPKQLTLHVHSAVVIVWYMAPQMQELYEAQQILPDGTSFCRNGTFDGLGETLNWDRLEDINEDPESGAHRLLREEPGQSQPLFKERERYQMYPMQLELKGPIPHDKWPLTAIFHRNKFRCEIPYNSLLYLPDGYVEEEAPEDGGRTIIFKWRDI